jgi:hypothetical protein
MDDERYYDEHIKKYERHVGANEDVVLPPSVLGSRAAEKGSKQQKQGGGSRASGERSP